MDKWNRDLLDQYCLQYNIGLVGLVPLVQGSSARLEDLDGHKMAPIDLELPEDLRDLKVEESSSMLRVVRGGIVEHDTIKPNSDWVSFRAEHKTFSKVASALNANESHTVVLQVGKSLFFEKMLYLTVLKF